MIRENTNKNATLSPLGDSFIRAVLTSGCRHGEPRCSRCSTELTVAFPVVGGDCTVCGAPALSMLIRMPMPPDTRLGT